MNDRNEVFATARRAWEAFAKGCQTADWDDFLDMVSEDVSFHVPPPKFRGENKGKARFREYSQYASVENGCRLTFHEPYSTVQDGQTVIFECEDEGVIRDFQVNNRICLSFDIADGKVKAFREYIGILPG